jgi:HK97 family phage major capsid protein
MAFSSALTEKAAKMREEFEGLLGKEDPSPEELEAASKMDLELADIETKANEALRLEAQAEARKKAEKIPVKVINTGGDGASEKQWTGMPARKTWFDQMVESAAFKAAAESGFSSKTKIELPNETPVVPGRSLFKAAGDPIMATQFGTRMTDTTLLGHVFAPIGVIDLVNVVNVPTTNVRYFQTSTFTNAADFIAEGTAKPEVQPRWAPVDAPIETIADWTAVTLQALDDLPQLRAVVDYDLRTAIEVKVDNAILNGTGTSPQIKGILTTVGIQSIAYVATTSPADMITKGLAAVNSGGYGQVNAVVMNPTDAWAMRVTKAATTGVYYFGAPSDAGATSLWGYPVVMDANMPAGFALVADFRMATLYQRMGITFIVGLKNDDLIKNLQTIVCEERLALAVRRPGAFAKVALA